MFEPVLEGTTGLKKKEKRKYPILPLCLHRPHRCMSSFQSYSTFSSENLSVSDGEEGNTSDHSHSGPLERLSASQEEHLDELLSHTPDIPIDISTQSDGLSDKECAVRRVKTQISLGKLCSDEHSYEVSAVDVCGPVMLALSCNQRGFQSLSLWSRLKYQQ